MVSMKDIGRICNVSEATVSKALRNNPKINALTRQRIQEVSRQHNYHPNALVEGIQTGRSKMIGVAYNNFTDSFAGAVMEGLLGKLGAAGYETLVICWDMIAAQGNQMLSRFSRRRLDGLLLFPMERLPSPEYQQELRAFQKPIVIIDQTWPGNEFSFVGSDNVHGGILATTHLLDHGITELGFIRYSRASSCEERWEGFQTAMRGHGLPVRDAWCVDAAGSADHGLELIRELLASPVRPDGLVCFNDYCALQALDAARELGVRVPEELSLLGFGDIKLISAMSRPRLTTVNQSPREIGRKAAEVLLSLIAAQGEVKATQARIPVELVVHETVRGACAGGERT